MKIKVGDKVKVIAGSSKGKEGIVLKTLKEKNRVIVEGCNVNKRHQKPNAQDDKGGIVPFEAPIDVSNVMLIDPKTKKPTRVGYKIKDNKKVRISKKSQEEIK